MMDDSKDNRTPARFLVENIDLLPMGRVLDVAMGKGRNALYLAKMGFIVEGIDISLKSLNAAKAAAAQLRIPLKTIKADIENNYAFDKNSYDAVICFNYLHRPLIPEIKNCLRSGGVIVYETFIIDQTRFGKPTNPDYLLKYNELLRLFQDFRCLRYREGIFDNQKAVAGIIAEKP